LCLVSSQMLCITFTYSRFAPLHLHSAQLPAVPVLILYYCS